MRWAYALCLLFAGVANASEADGNPDWPWVDVGRYQPPNVSGITIWVNMDSLQRAGSNRLRLWIKYQNDQPDNDGVIATLVYEEIECDRDWHTTYSVVNYSENGRVLSSSRGDRTDAEPIVPDSLLAGIMPFTCAAGGMQH